MDSVNLPGAILSTHYLATHLLHMVAYRTGTWVQGGCPLLKVMSMVKDRGQRRFCGRFLSLPLGWPVPNQPPLESCPVTLRL